MITAPHRSPAKITGAPTAALIPRRAQRLGQRAGLAVEAVVARGAMGAPDRRGDRVAVEDERRPDGDRLGALAPHAHDERGAVAVVAQDVADARVERAPDLLGDEAEEPLGLDLGGDRGGDPAQRGLLLGHALQGVLGPAALGHVAQVAAEQRRAGELRPRHRQLDGERAAVGAHGRELDRVPDDPRGAGVHVAPQAAAMVLAQRPGGIMIAASSRPTISSAL